MKRKENKQARVSSVVDHYREWKNQSFFRATKHNMPQQQQKNKMNNSAFEHLYHCTRSKCFNCNKISSSISNKDCFMTALELHECLKISSASVEPKVSVYELITYCKFKQLNHHNTNQQWRLSQLSIMTQPPTQWRKTSTPWQCTQKTRRTNATTLHWYSEKAPHKSAAMQTAPDSSAQAMLIKKRHKFTTT